MCEKAQLHCRAKLISAASASQVCSAAQQAAGLSSSGLDAGQSSAMDSLPSGCSNDSSASASATCLPMMEAMRAAAEASLSVLVI